MKVAFNDLGAQHAEIEDEVWPRFREIFASTAFIGGAALAQFEAAYADYVAAGHCVGVANGTDAVELALRAVGVAPGGEVILPANTFVATAEAVARIGAVPVLVDVDTEHLLIHPEAVRAALTDRTQAVVPVHLFGQAAPMAQLRAVTDLPLVEDAAQAQGARQHDVPAGALGAVAATSFYPGKNLGAAGDAGAVTTDDAAVAKQVRLLGAHGSPQKYQHEIVGMNSRLDALQAVYLHAKLRRLERWNAARRVAADRYRDLLSEHPQVILPAPAEGNQHVWHLYVIRVADRDRVMAALTAAGIGVGVHYPVPVHLTRAFEYLDYGPGTFPVAEAAASTMISLPMHPHLSAEQQEFVCATLVDAFAAAPPTPSGEVAGR